MPDDTSETNRLLEQAAQGDGRFWGRCWRGTGTGSAAWLRCGWTVGCKGGSTLGRDPGAYLEASARLAEYLRNPSMPFFLWLRFLTGQKLVTLHRHHLGVQMRDAGQEVALYAGPLPEASSAAPGRPAPGP